MAQDYLFNFLKPFRYLFIIKQSLHVLGFVHPASQTSVKGPGVFVTQAQFCATTSMVKVPIATTKSRRTIVDLKQNKVS